VFLSDLRPVDRPGRPSVQTLPPAPARTLVGGPEGGGPPPHCAPAGSVLVPDPPL